MSAFGGHRDTDEAGERADPGLWAREVATVVDPLLADVWSLVWANEDAPIAIFLRMAYLQGYRDALEAPERGELFERLGVEVPAAPVKKPSATRARLPRGSSRNSGS